MSLTKLSLIVQKAVQGTIVLIVLGIVTKLLIVPAAQNIYIALFPPKDLPNPVYGKLAPLQFTRKNVVGTNQAYELNTTSGDLPIGLPNKMYVLKYRSIPFSYEAGKEASEHAQTLGFDNLNLTTSLKGDLYRWFDPATDSRLEIDINTKRLSKETDLEQKGSYYTRGTLKKEDAVSLAKSILQAIGRLDDELYRNGTQEVYLGKFYIDTIAKATTNYEVQIARVDFFRSIADYPILGPDPKIGLIHAYVGKTAGIEEIETLQMPVLSYSVRSLETTSNATYPIITVKSAWDEVRKGNGIISSVVPEGASPFEDYNPTGINKILINEIYLAYYDDGEDQEYMQPIYVFDGNYLSNTGRGTISIYYPAISGQWIQEVEEVEDEAEQPPTTEN